MKNTLLYLFIIAAFAACQKSDLVDLTPRSEAPAQNAGLRDAYCSCTSSTSLLLWWDPFGPTSTGSYSVSVYNQTTGLLEQRFEVNGTSVSIVNLAAQTPYRFVIVKGSDFIIINEDCTDVG